MPMSALVVTLESDSELQGRVRDALTADPRFTVGEQQRNQLPVTLETETHREGIECIEDELPDLEGVSFVHVVRVDFSDVESFDEKLPPKRRGASKS